METATLEQPKSATTITIKEPEAPATFNQKMYLRRLTGINYKDVPMTKKEASDMISEHLTAHPDQATARTNYKTEKKGTKKSKKGRAKSAPSIGKVNVDTEQAAKAIQFLKLAQSMGIKL